MKARAPKDSVQGILHDLKMKTAIFSRCYVEYGTYLDELESDKIRLNVAKSQGQDTKQLESVMKETSDMLPITQQHAKKYHAGYVDFWKQRKETLEKGLTAAAASDRAKYQRELNSEAQKLEKTIKRKHNPLTSEETAAVEEIFQDIKCLADHAKLPQAKARAPSPHIEAPSAASPASPSDATPAMPPQNKDEHDPSPTAVSPPVAHEASRTEVTPADGDALKTVDKAADMNPPAASVTEAASPPPTNTHSGPVGTTGQGTSAEDSDSDSK